MHFTMIFLRFCIHLLRNEWLYKNHFLDTLADTLRCKTFYAQNLLYKNIWLSDELC